MFYVFRNINTDSWLRRFDQTDDHPVLERPELFQSLRCLEGRRGQLGETEKRRRPENVDPDVAVSEGPRPFLGSS